MHSINRDPYLCEHLLTKKKENDFQKLSLVENEYYYNRQTDGRIHKFSEGIIY